MDQSRRAVEAYWRARMVDGVTSDEDKVAPVYKLEEICELIRTSPAGIVKEVSDYILKRLDHKSPIVKHKALRLIKYAVGKSGTEFRREMQRHSATVRQLFHYKAQPDPLKGDALNKAVRDTAHEVIAAVFAPDDLKAAAQPETINKRIEGFGSTNFQMSAADEKRSFLTEVVELGAQSIKQGFNTIAAAHSLRKDDNGSISSYKGLTLRRSLTKETDTQDNYGGYERPKESGSSVYSKDEGSGGSWNKDSRAIITNSMTNEDVGSGNVGIKSREERLLETIVTSGGVRLQPTRDAVQAFLGEAAKMDPMAMTLAIESKLQSAMWQLVRTCAITAAVEDVVEQTGSIVHELCVMDPKLFKVPTLHTLNCIYARTIMYAILLYENNQVRMKAICVVESILRKKGEQPFASIAYYFSENRDSIVKCSQLPQVSLREKASKVLNSLDGKQDSGASLHQEPSNEKTKSIPLVQMPDLIDTGDDEHTTVQFLQSQADKQIDSPKPHGSLVDDLFGSSCIDDRSTTERRSEEDPFADVSFYAKESKEENDLFSGLSVDKISPALDINGPASSKFDFLDVFHSDSDQVAHVTNTKKNDVNDLISGLSLHGSTQKNKQNGTSPAALSHSTVSHGSNQPKQFPASGTANSMLGANSQFPFGLMQQNMPPNIMMSHVYGTNQINNAAMGNAIMQQQLLYQNFGNMSAGFGHQGTADGSHSSPLPDVFQMSNNPIQIQTPGSSSKKEDSKAFDFISDHLLAARGSKKLI